MTIPHLTREFKEQLRSVVEDWLRRKWAGKVEESAERLSRVLEKSPVGTPNSAEIRESDVSPGPTRTPTTASSQASPQTRQRSWRRVFGG